MTKEKTTNKGESKTAVLAAVIGNLVIAVIKFIAVTFTGSSAMLAEGIHSVVDSGNGGLMLYGSYQSKKPPDKMHPFGHGRELYFWTLIVALSIFAVGGGVSVYEGIIHLITPVKIENPIWNYSVLGFSALFESITWYYGWRAFRKEMRGKTVWETFRMSKDPTSFTVLLEDSTALIGLMIAFLGIFLGQQFNIPYFDGTASILIGLLLGLVALLLGYETKSLLIGEALEQKKLDEIQQIAKDEQKVEKVIKARAIYLAPEEVVLTLELKFIKNISGEDLRRAVNRIKQKVQEKFPEIARVYYEATSLSAE